MRRATCRSPPGRWTTCRTSISPAFRISRWARGTSTTATSRRTATRSCSRCCVASGSAFRPGTFNTIVVRPIIKTGGIFAEGGEAELYLTDDERRIPVRVKTRMSIGTANFYLTDYDPGTPGAPDPAGRARRSMPGEPRADSTAAAGRAGRRRHDAFGARTARRVRRARRPAAGARGVPARQGRGRRLRDPSRCRAAASRSSSSRCRTSSRPTRFRAVAAAVASAASLERTCLWMLGGHVVKTGLNRVLDRSDGARGVTHVAVNGSTVIHDYEACRWGGTSEDVEAGLADGTFGMAEETGRDMNLAIRRGASEGLGLGEALAADLAARDDNRYPDLSLLLADAAARRPAHRACGDRRGDHPSTPRSRRRGDRRDLVPRFHDAVARPRAGSTMAGPR